MNGEELPKVMYRLIEADHYVNKQILVVGGGDSAVEAAMGLAHQVGNKVTLSYRQEGFTRIKERNSQRIADCIRSGKVKVLFKSAPVEFKTEFGYSRRERRDPGYSQRLRLDLRRRRAAHGIPQEDRCGIRVARRDFRGKRRGQASNPCKNGIARAGRIRARLIG